MRRRDAADTDAGAIRRTGRRGRLDWPGARVERSWTADVERHDHRVLAARAEERALDAVGRELLEQPGVRNDRESHLDEIRRRVRERAQLFEAFAPRAPPQLVDDHRADALPALARVDRQRADLRDLRAERAPARRSRRCAARASRRRIAWRARPARRAFAAAGGPPSRLAEMRACSAPRFRVVRRAQRDATSLLHSISSHGTERRIETAERFVDLRFGDHERRQQSHDRFGRAVHDHSARQPFLDDRRRIARQLQAPDQARRRGLP